MEERRMLVQKRKRQRGIRLLMNLCEMILAVVVMEVGAQHDIAGLILIGFALLGICGVSLMEEGK